MHAEAWEEREREFFAVERSQFSSHLLLIPQNYKKNSKPTGALGGRWIFFEKSSEEPLAWAELHCFYKYFNCFFVYLSALPEGDWSRPAYAQALSRLISAIFIASECDQIQLICAPKARAQVMGLTLGECKYAHDLRPVDSIFRRQFSGKALCKFPIIAIDAHDWWQKESAVKDKQALAYLVKRVSREKHTAGRATKKPKSRLSLIKILLGRR